MTMIFSKMLFGVSLVFFALLCLFLGIISTATLVGISARILSDERMLDFPEGVDFKSIDGQPSKIIILTLSPKNASAPHMQFMSMVSQALNEKGRKSLLACKKSEERFNVLTGSKIN